MRSFIGAAVLALALTSCEALAPVTPSVPPGSVQMIAPPTPLPPGVVDPVPLMRQVVGGTSVVQRVDRITAKLVSWDDFMKESGGVGPASSQTGQLWAIAVLGSIRIQSLIDLPNAECAVYAFDAATGEARSMRGGPAAVCAPYFDR